MHESNLATRFCHEYDAWARVPFYAFEPGAPAN